MTILYLHQYFNTPNMPGGTRSYEMARRLVQAGHQVHMITTIRSRTAHSQRWHETVEAGIRVHWYRLPYHNAMGFAQRVCAFLRYAYAAARKALSIGGDVVFATSTPLTVALPAVRVRRRLGIPMVFEVRDLWPELPIAIGVLRNPLMKAAARALERYAYSNAERIVALSPGMAQGVTATSFPVDRVHVIPNGCDIDMFDVGEEPGLEFRRRHRWIGNRPLVVYVGTFGRINGVEFLVRVAHKMLNLNPEVRFLLVGDGAEFDQVSRTAEELQVLDRNVRLLPSVPKAQVPGILSAATVATSLFIDLPAMWANSANKFFDALAAGTAVAVNYGGWQAELLEAENAGIMLPAADYTTAARLLADLLCDGPRLERMASNARRLGRERFNRDRLAADFLGVIEKAAVAISPGAPHP